MLARRLEALAYLFHQFQPAVLVGDVPRPFRPGGGALAQVVEQQGEAHIGGRREQRGLLQRHQRVHPGIDLGVVLFGLGHAEQGLQLRQQPGQGAAVAQHLHEYLGIALTQGALHFHPYALRRQVGQFVLVDNLGHQGEGFRGDAKPQVGIAGGEAGGAQYPQRVLHESVRHVPQHFGSQVPLAAVGIDDVTVGGAGHGVDGEVAPQQVLLQGDRGVAVHGEAGVAVPPLALGARQGVLVFGIGVQEHREILAHLLEALIQQVGGGGAHHHPVVLAAGVAQQGIAHRAADQVDLHEAAIASPGRLTSCTCRSCICSWSSGRFPARTATWSRPTRSRYPGRWRRDCRCGRRWRPSGRTGCGLWRFCDWGG